MSIAARLVAAGSIKEYFSTGLAGRATNIVGTEQVPVFASAVQTFGTFKAVTRTTAGTTIITSPQAGGSIHITDLILSTDKTANSTVTVRFTDGTDTVNIILADSANNTVNLAIAFAGRIQGWEDARLEIETVQNVSATVTAGYVKHPIGVKFAEWDALR